MKVIAFFNVSNGGCFMCCLLCLFVLREASNLTCDMVLEKFG